MKNRFKIILSLVLLLYCVLLVGMSHFDVRPNNFFQALFELITIPALLLICFLIVRYILEWRKLKFKWSAKDALPVFILLGAVIILVLATVFE